MSGSLPQCLKLFLLCAILLLWSCSGKKGVTPNRLQFASSPYLQEHADNPVDWYEWGEEALNKAKKENKPLLISIGYAACHWCHEMEKESFMDTAVARVMNENFVCIKVDREERPDIDQVYMNALQLLTGNGGWPLNAFALPDGKPFFAGTYYPKKAWLGVLSGISKAYAAKHELVVTQANALLNGIAEEDHLGVDTLSGKHTAPEYAALYNDIYRHADLTYGGLKGPQKFPTPAFAEFLLQDFYISHRKESLRAAVVTLNKMALGGIHDHVGGGFARYTTDSAWKIPHFEKMLYDNAQLASLYAHAYQVTGDSFYREIMIGALDFIGQTLAAPGGGYYSSLNADTKAGEGAFYAWRKKDFLAAVDNDQAIADYFHVSDEGNWEQGLNILYAEKTPAEFAVGRKLRPVDFAKKLALVKTALSRERSRREKPTVDSKIITAWNCIALKAYADAYAATGVEDYLVKARSCAAFIEKGMLKADGRIMRHFNNGKGYIDGFLDDYAWAGTAFTRLYQVSFDKHWLMLAKRITDYAIVNFGSRTSNLFFYSGKNDELVLRKTEIADDAIPSSNAVFAKLLYTLGTIFADSTYSARALNMYNAVTLRIKTAPHYYLQWCSLAAVLSTKSYEVVVTGKDAFEKNKELNRYFLPTIVLMGSIDDDSLPLLEHKLVAGKTLIYVCTDRLCKRPEETVAAALAQIK
ncbi:MAG: thioredoxin domain-containing protein [Chitinophagaceae bacterium]|nr:thioredoxin domain-containing protein [Chitinophagaceae bacterium]